VPKRYSTWDGEIHLTPHCAGLTEIEWHIDRMQADLELRKKARREFARFKSMKAKPPFDAN
jgi:hypothetical protein